MCEYTNGKQLEKTYLEVVFLVRKNFKLIEDFHYQSKQDFAIEREVRFNGIS